MCNRLRPDAPVAFQARTSTRRRTGRRVVRVSFHAPGVTFSPSQVLHVALRSSKTDTFYDAGHNVRAPRARRESMLVPAQLNARPLSRLCPTCTRCWTASACFRRLCATASTRASRGARSPMWWPSASGAPFWAPRLCTPPWRRTPPPRCAPPGGPSHSWPTWTRRTCRAPSRGRTRRRPSWSSSQRHSPPPRRCSTRAPCASGSPPSWGRPPCGRTVRGIAL